MKKEAINGSLLTAALFFAAVACASAPALAESTDSPAKELCRQELTEKGLGKAAGERFMQSCLEHHGAAAPADVRVQGRGASKLTNEQRRQISDCGNTAAGRHLQGETLKHFMADCLAK